MFFVVYDDRGAIMFSTTSPEPGAYRDRLIAEGYRFVAVPTDGLTHWVDPESGAIRERPLLALELPGTAAVEEEVVLRGIPGAANVRIEGPHSTAVDHAGGDLPLTFVVPGTYTITVEAFPARPAAISLEVQA